MRYLDEHYYHVHNRGAHKQPLFFSSENYLHCLTLLKKYKTRYAVSIIAYCLMPNHYHLLLRQDSGGSISRFIQTTFNAYAQAVNKQRNHSGTLFQGKAKAILVDSDEYLIHLSRYIHLNPINLHPSEGSQVGLNWDFSSYKEWIGTRNGTLVDLSLRDLYFKTGKDYKQFVEEYNPKTDTEKIKKFLFDE